ncbi:SPOR domain-containing protein [Alcanivorax sp. 24]|uniref:SPOR domain-containing protein n=1 Tax=Alcanivorax sp. 24 TaxID=2545266 RepID=UPI001061EE39|nr:SPOR domain-containing protein [Alcanivorax sp. 24]
MIRDDEYFYEGAERGDLLDALNGYAHEGSTAVLEGEHGSGVSTLLGMVCMALVDDFEVIRLDGDDELNANAPVEAMLTHFGVDREGLADALKQALADTRLVIVVDNADRADEAALATMAALKEKLGGRLAYLFGGYPGAAERVVSAGLAVADTLALPPLDESEVVAFADEVYGVTLGEEEAESLLAESEGQPGALLALLDERADAAPAPLADSPARRPLPWRHVLAVGALVLVVLVLWLASGGDEEPRPSRPVALDLPKPPATPPEEPAQQTAPTSDEPPSLPAIRDPERTREALASYADNARTFKSREEPPSKPRQSEEAPRAADPVSEPDAGTAPAATPQPAARPKPRPASSDDGYHHDGWLASRPDSEWFLQVTATGREDGAHGVLDVLDRKGAYYPARRGEETVYVVLAGPYASRDAAVRARDGLPEQLRKAGPFPRSMASIRKELQ